MKQQTQTTLILGLLVVLLLLHLQESLFKSSGKNNDAVASRTPSCDCSKCVSKPASGPSSSAAVVASSPLATTAATTAAAPAATQAAKLPACNRRPVDKAFELPTRCPDEGRYVREWSQKVPPRKWTIVAGDVHMGYGIAAILDGLGIKGHTPREHSARVQAYARGGKAGSGTLCGACADCKRPPNTPAKPAKILGWHAFAFDRQLSNAEAMPNFFDDNLTSYHAAVSDKSGVAQFVAAPFGSDDSAAGGAAKKAQVNVTTLDDALPDELGYVDVLRTQGDDYKVAEGAKKWLDAGRVGLYIFELHGRDTKLADHVKRMAKAGYRCYFPLEWFHVPSNKKNTLRHLVPISGECWRAEYDLAVGWYNGLCVNLKETELIDGVLEPMTQRQ